MNQYKILAKLPLPISFFQTTQPAITIVTTIVSSCVGSFPMNFASVNVMSGRDWVDDLEGSQMSFSGRVCTTSTSKTIGNGIDHTLDNPKGIFLLSLLTFSCRLLVIIVPTSNISTFEATSTFSSITATVIVMPSDQIV